jgi:hypothetical protein
MTNLPQPMGVTPASARPQFTRSPAFHEAERALHWLTFGADMAIAARDPLGASVELDLAAGVIRNLRKLRGATSPRVQTTIDEIIRSQEQVGDVYPIDLDFLPARRESAAVRAVSE